MPTKEESNLVSNKVSSKVIKNEIKDLIVEEVYLFAGKIFSTIGQILIESVTNKDKL